MKRLILELSLKPFRDSSDEGIRAVTRDILRQWRVLIDEAEEVSFLLWTADGSEILDYRGGLQQEIDWARWIGIANGPWDESYRTLHSWRWPYCENPAKITYERLAYIVRAFKEEIGQATGKRIRVGATFDPGPEFAESPFKYERHKEIAGGDTMGKGKWVNCAAVLHADDRSYAGFPDGIRKGTTLGTFLGRQSDQFLRDLGFDYLWLSNGFAFALAAWNVTGEVFDGTSFNPTQATRVRESILRFWHDFRRACPSFPIETRGSNLSTGMDLSAHASPVREIYQGGFNLVAPVNSPWAAINGDYGLELVGWLSHIAELPPNNAVPFRLYLHDPWWANSPWLDRYGREPNDIYLPLAAGRIAADGSITQPSSVSFLTIDDSYGNRPDVVPNEVTPHIQQALRDFPDAPGLVTWIYPFDEYHDWTFGQDQRVNEVFFGDWFMRGAVNHGLPLNTVVSTKNFIHIARTRPEVFNQTILLCPAPDADSPLADAVLERLSQGGQLLLYGPLRRLDKRVLALLKLEIGPPLSGELQLETSLPPDRVELGATPRKLHFRSLTSGGGAEEISRETELGNELVAQVSAGNDKRAFAVIRPIGVKGSRLGWVRGALSEEISQEHMLPLKDDAKTWYHPERFMRLMLSHYGYLIRFTKPTVEMSEPLILAARCRNALFFSGFTTSTNIKLHWRFPEGVPIPIGCDVLIHADGTGTLTLPRTLHRECRVFVHQGAASEVSCRETCAGAVKVNRRLTVTGLLNATLTFFHEPLFSSPVRVQESPPYLGMGRDLPIQQHSLTTVAHNVTGTVIISW